MTYTFRNAVPNDLPDMFAIFDDAKEKMRQSGNHLQWTNGYPEESLLREDMARNESYVIEHEGKIVATFVLAFGEEPTYKQIYEGAWVNDMPYGTIHRIASRHGEHGIFGQVVEWASRQVVSLRIDTHRDNAPMRHLVIKYGFIYCGIIYLQNGDERLAYQRIGL